MQSRLPNAIRLSASSMGLICFVSLVFALEFANRPLWHTDLWDHVNYGRYILSSGTIPDSEPLLPTAASAPMTCTDWGAKITMAWLADSRFAGLAALQFCYGSLIAFALLFVGSGVLKRSRSFVFSIIACVAFLFVNWQQLLIIRPQIAGVACFTAVLLVTSTKLVRRRWVAILLPVLFAIWANLHGSFAMGLTLLGLTCLGRAADTYRHTCSISAAISAPAVRRLILLTILCACSALLNPNGIRIYTDVLTIGHNPNISTMYEWKPLSWQMKQGRAAGIVTAAVVAVLAFSRRRIRYTDIIPLCFFLALALWSSRMLNWYAPVSATVIGVYGAAAARQITHQPRIGSPPARSALWTSIAVVTVATSVAATNFGRHVLAGQTNSEDQCLSPGTPVRATRFLTSEDNRCRGPAFVPAEWSGYIMYHTDTVQPFVNLHVHVLPVGLWNDYVRLLSGPPDWEEILERYEIRLAVTDRQRQGPLISLLRKSPEFSLLYEDPQAAIFCRRARANDRQSTDE